MQNNLQIWKEHLDSNQAFTTPLPEIIADMVKTIPNDEIPQKMKLLMAVNEIVLFTAQFHRNIQHPNGSLIPINSISFIFAPSGVGKDSSINLLYKQFNNAYSLINQERKALAIGKAKQMARDAGKTDVDNPQVWQAYYDHPMPLRNSLSTNEGFIQHLNTLDEDKLGAGYIYSGEFASELQSSPTLTSNLTLLSELYDEGKKELKVLKDRTKQNREINCLSVSGLFVSSPDILFMDKKTKDSLIAQLSSKLSRRSFFCYTPEQTITEQSSNSIDEIIAKKMHLERIAREQTSILKQYIDELTPQLLQKRNTTITISDQAYKLMLEYKEYCFEQANTIQSIYKLSQLACRHKYWKAFKVAGALAVFKNLDEITSIEYKQAIYFTELFQNDLLLFEKELFKEPYELFANYVKMNTNDGICKISLHELKRLNFIKSIDKIDTQLKDLIKIVMTLDDINGVLTMDSKGIIYKELKPTNTLELSYMPCSGTKEQRTRNCTAIYKTYTRTFADLANMLKTDGAYSPFKFRNGIRSRVNAYGEIKWIVLDIDKSDLTDMEMHRYLQNFNHHIARTSNPDNNKKFRILLELESAIDLDDQEYKRFIQAICDDLQINADILPKSQAIFSYSNRQVLSTLNARPLPVKEYLLIAKEIKQNTRQDVSTLTDEQKQELINNAFNTFDYAFQAKDGEGSLALYKAARHAKNLGMSCEDVIELIHEINNYWQSPMEESRLQTTILNQIPSWYERE